MVHLRLRVDARQQVVAGPLLRPDSGRVIVDGTDASELSDLGRTTLRRERIGIVFQQANLIPSLIALDQSRATGDPAVPLVDEATSALDGARGTEIMKLLAELIGERGVATPPVTHDTTQLGHAHRVLGTGGARGSPGPL